MSGGASPSSLVSAGAQGALGIDAQALQQQEWRQNQMTQYLGIGQQQAIGNITAGTNSAIAQLQPTAMESNNALQNYFNLLGISTPTQGINAYAQSQQQIATLQNQIQAATSAYGSAMSAYNNSGLNLSQDQKDAYQRQAQVSLAQIAQLQTQMSTAQSQSNQGMTAGGNSASIQSALSNTPGYQFALQQGLAAVNQNNAITGLLNSGNAIMGAETFATGLASQTYQNAVANAAQAYNSTSGANGQIAQLQAAQGTNLADINQNTGQQIAGTFQNLNNTQSPIFQQAASIAAGAGNAMAGIAKTDNVQSSALQTANIMGSTNAAAYAGGYTGSGYPQQNWNSMMNSMGLGGGV